MKTLFISVATAALLLSACSSSKTAEAPRPAQISVEEAIALCKQSAGETADRAVFDACMKDKGFQRKASADQANPPAADASAPAAVQ